MAYPHEMNRLFATEQVIAIRHCAVHGRRSKFGPAAAVNSCLAIMYVDLEQSAISSDIKSRIQEEQVGQRSVQYRNSQGCGCST